MNKKIIIAIITLLVTTGIIAIFTSGSNETTTQEIQTKVVNASLMTDEAQYDFGTIDINGGNVTTEFPVTNIGAESITILDGTTSCACTSAELEGVGFDMHKGMNKTVIIAPGETKILSATYDPLFHGPKGTGKITREVILKTDSMVTPEVRMRFVANVIKG